MKAHMISLNTGGGPTDKNVWYHQCFSYLGKGEVEETGMMMIMENVVTPLGRGIRSFRGGIPKHRGYMRIFSVA